MDNKYIKAGTMESGYWEFDGNLGCNTMYIVNYLKGDFNIEIFKESLNKVAHDIPFIKCKLTNGKWRDKWEKIDNFNVDMLIQMIRVDKEDFYNKAYSEFEKLDNKKINIDSESPLKIKLFYNEEIQEKVVVFCIHHGLADGRGCFQLVELIGNHYNAILHNKNFEFKENYRSMSKLIKNFNILNFLNMLWISLKGFLQPFLMASFKPIIEKEPVSLDDGESIEKIYINKEDLKKLKAYYKDANFTVNDIILYLTMKVLSKYNMRLDKPSKYVGAALGIDLRRYFKKDVNSIANYSAMDMFIIKDKDLNNTNLVSKKLKAFKKKSIGLGFLFQLFANNIFPISTQKKMLNRWALSFIVQGSVRMIQTTNIGKLDEYVKPFGGLVENVSFVGPSPRYGFPEISVSGYNDTLTIYFTKYNDVNNLNLEVKNEFESLLNKILED